MNGETSMSLRSVMKQGALWLLTATAVVWVGCSGGQAAGPAPKTGPAGAPTGEAPPPVPVEKRPMEAFKAAVAEFASAEKAGWNEATCRRVADAFGSVIAKDARFPEAYYNQGAAYHKCGLVKEAEASYRKALQVNPKYAPALVNLGTILFKSGQAGTAEQYFQQAVAADNKNGEAHYHMAAMLRLRGGKDTIPQALRHLRASLAIDAKNMHAYALLAKLYYDLAAENRNFYDLAQLVCEQGRKVNENFAPLYNVYGLIYVGKKNVTAAMRQFKKAVQLDPNFVDAHLNIGAISLNFRDYATAEASFSKVLALEPNNLQALVGLGVAYRGQGKPEEAKRQYEKALALNRNNAAIYFNLGVLHQDYLSEGKEAVLRQAQKFFEDFIRLDGTNAAKTAEARERIKNIDELIAAMKAAPPAAPAPKGAPAAPPPAAAPAGPPAAEAPKAGVNVKVNVSVGGKK
jgi:tetratricopeptide (TPR) repeat protein